MTGKTHSPIRTTTKTGVAPPQDYPLPTSLDLKKAREEFKKIETRDFFYWSVTKLVTTVLDSEERPEKKDELVRALMMLLTTWNRNYYRFFSTGKGKEGMTMEKHFNDLESVIAKHYNRLIEYRSLKLQEEAQIPEQDILAIFNEVQDVLGRVGAAKCLHLLAPHFFPLWDAAILKGYGMEKGPHRHLTDADRYVAFMGISKIQLDNLGDFSSFTDKPLKSLDEYNYCRFTKNVKFD